MTADRIHVFSHRLGLVVFGFLILYMMVPIVPQMSSRTGDSLVAAFFILIIAAVAYGLVRIVGWIVSALFDETNINASPYPPSKMALKFLLPVILGLLFLSQMLIFTTPDGSRVQNMIGRDLNHYVPKR